MKILGRPNPKQIDVPEYKGADRRKSNGNGSGKTWLLAFLAALVTSSAVYNFVRVEGLVEDGRKEDVARTKVEDARYYEIQRMLAEVKMEAADAKKERQTLMDMVQTLSRRTVPPARPSRVVTKGSDLYYVCHVGEDGSTTIRTSQEAVALHLREHFRDYGGGCR